jgi:hypothetical protein
VVGGTTTARGGEEVREGQQRLGYIGKVEETTTARGEEEERRGNNG